MRDLSARRWSHGALVIVIALIMLGADADSRFNRIGHKMMCACSCGQILLECNHVGCPDSSRMIDELRTQVGSGGDTSVMNWFVAKYGAIVLAAPLRGGFDTVAWVTPLAVFFFAIVGTVLLVRTWTRRSPETAAGVPGSLPAALGIPADQRMRERIRREMER